MKWFLHVILGSPKPLHLPSSWRVLDQGGDAVHKPSLLGEGVPGGVLCRRPGTGQACAHYLEEVQREPCALTVSGLPKPTAAAPEGDGDSACCGTAGLLILIKSDL